MWTCLSPWGTLICVTGVSGSGKSTLINRTLQPDLEPAFLSLVAQAPLAYDAIEGIEHCRQDRECGSISDRSFPPEQPGYLYGGIHRISVNLFVGTSGIEGDEGINRDVSLFNVIGRTVRDL